MLRTSALLAVLALAGCATTAGRPAAKREEVAASMLDCRMEKPTGSNITQKVCTRREPTEQEKKFLHELVHMPPSVQMEKGK